MFSNRFFLLDGIIYANQPKMRKRHQNQCYQEDFCCLAWLIEWVRDLDSQFGSKSLESKSREVWIIRLIVQSIWTIRRFTVRSISHSRLPRLNAWGSSAGPGAAAIMQEGSDQQQPAILPPILSTVHREHSLPPHLMYEVFWIPYVCSIEKRHV